MTMRRRPDEVEEKHPIRDDLVNSISLRSPLKPRKRLSGVPEDQDPEKAEADEQSS